MQCSSNPLTNYLNINSLQNKIDALRVITKDFLLDIFCIDETKLDESFPDHQFKIDGYKFRPFRRDRNKFEGGEIVYFKDDLIVRRLNDFETNISETISLELTISDKKWFIMIAYRPPIEINKLTFLMKFPTPLLKQ